MDIKNPENLPDFIIAGAMKSATTTLHSILNKHPDVYIPKGELHFFDMDNFFEHNDFYEYDKINDKWYSWFDEQKLESRFAEYHELFKKHQNKIKGEDSTGYLASEQAFKRISFQKKEIKIIVMLRNPTSRTYSNYNHLLKRGKAFYSFEDTIQYLPNTILKRSMYKTQLENLFKYIPRDRVKIVIFENFLEEPKKTILDICDFLSLDFNKFNQNVFYEKSNSGQLPRFNKLKYIFSRNFPHFSLKFNLKNRIYETQSSRKDNLFIRLLFVIHNFINPVSVKNSKVMNPVTKDFLDSFFRGN